MTKWEYKTIKVTSSLGFNDEQLNVYGTLGWELASHRVDFHGYHVYIFKRSYIDKPVQIDDCVELDPRQTGGTL